MTKYCWLLNTAIVSLMTLSFSAQAAISCSWLHPGASAGSDNPDKGYNFLALSKQMTDMSPEVLKLALQAYKCAREKGLDKNHLLTVVDYNKPDTQKRLWVIDLSNDKVLYHTLVAHGQGSGDVSPTTFSDKPETHASSVGVFTTGQTYTGHDGYALRLNGLEPGFNDDASKRDIVVHGAWYVSQSFVNKFGKLGRSWGCLAVPQNSVSSIVNTIKDGSLVFSYYPNKNWLQSSKFLHCNGNNSDSTTPAVPDPNTPVDQST